MSKTRPNPAQRAGQRIAPYEPTGDPAMDQTLRDEQSRKGAERLILNPKSLTTPNPTKPKTRAGHFLHSVVESLRPKKSAPKPAAPKVIQPGIDRPLSSAERDSLSKRYLGK